MEQNDNVEDSLTVAAAGISMSDGFLNKSKFESDEDILRTTIPDIDPVSSLTINNALSSAALKKVLLEHPSVKFLTFNAGILPETAILDFNSHIVLSKLRKLTVRIRGNTPISVKNPPIPNEYQRLFHFLYVVEFHELEGLDIICSPDRGTCLPLASAIIPCYEHKDSSPLMDLIRLNRKTMKSISVGPTTNKCYLRLSPCDSSLICEQPRGNHQFSGNQQLEVFKGFPNYPLLRSWSKMLRPQKHLTKLYVAFNDPEVWTDVAEAVMLSSNSLQILKFKAFGCEPSSLDLEVLKNCSRLTDLGIRYLGMELKGWEFLPVSVKRITLGGPFDAGTAILMAKALYMIEEVSVLIKPAYMDTEATVSQPLNILQHPTFEFLNYAPPTLKEFSVDSIDVPLDFEPIKRWTEFEDFKFFEHSNSEFSLRREAPPPVVVVPVEPQSEAEDTDDSMFFGPCMTSLAW